MAVTAVVTLQDKGESVQGQTFLGFAADYTDDRNKDWAKYTPALSVQMHVVDEVAELFEPGGRYVLTFEPGDVAPVVEEPAAEEPVVEDEPGEGPSAVAG